MATEDLGVEYYTDKYFLRSYDILEKEGINPLVKIKIFCRGTGKLPVNLDSILVNEVFDESPQAFSRGCYEVICKKFWFKNKNDIKVFITKKSTFQNCEPIAIFEGRILDLIRLETLYLGILSHEINCVNKEIAWSSGIDHDEVTRKCERLREIYKGIDLSYFGARHYHYSLQKEMGKIALDAGWNSTSTDACSSDINQPGVGTIPHILILVLSYFFGKENATVKALELFDKHIDKEVPRIVLVDTFNQEITESIKIKEYCIDHDIKNFGVRIDTCGENFGQYTDKKGVSLELIHLLRTGGCYSNLDSKNMKSTLESMFAENAIIKDEKIILSSGFANEEKAKEFMKANIEFKNKMGYWLFNGVGVGEIYPSMFCTADLFEVNGTSIYKTGRPVENVDYDTMKRII